MITQEHTKQAVGRPRRLFCCFETEILLPVKNLCIKTPLMMDGERKINKMFIYPREKPVFPCKNRDRTLNEVYFWIIMGNEFGRQDTSLTN